MLYTLCKVSEIPERGAKLVEFFGRGAHVYQVNGKPVAVANVCLHIGGTLECKDDTFVCQWHGAACAMEDGHRLVAPAPANSKLMFLPTHVDGDDFNYVWGE
ncbi:MAG: Rieske (2Fe-2S) protein [Phototrophicaceae bacterium]|jgi:nitrite reductase/ring-hydroxylating ferredoxin subunit